MASLRTLSLLALVILVSALLSPAADPAKPPTKEQIEKLIRDLGSDDFETRQNATQKLWEAGRAAEELLRPVLKSDDAEVRRRAGEVLEKFKWGIYPDTPREIVERIGRYQAGDRNEKQTVIRELFERGADGCAALLRIVRAEEDAEIRRDLAHYISSESSRAIPDLLSKNAFATLDELQELTLTAEPGSSAPNYAAYWFLRGKLDDKIKEQRAKADKGDASAATVLGYLYRVKGDLKDSASAFETAKKQELLEATLAEAGDWKGLVKVIGDPNGVDLSGLGYRAAYYRLAGDRREVDRLVAEVVKRAGDPNDPDVWSAAKVLLLNDRVSEALGLLARSKDSVSQVEILIAQMRLPEAIEIAAKDENADNPSEIAVLRGRLLFLLGQRDKAKALFTKIESKIHVGQSLAWHDRLVETLFRLGLKEEAFTTCARLLAATAAEGNQRRLLEKVFPGKDDQAETWWRFLAAKSPSEDSAKTMAKLREVLAGKGARDLETLAADAARWAEALTPIEQEQALLAIAETCLRGGLEKAGKGHIETAVKLGNSHRAALRLGDFYADKKEWERAAEAYGRAWEKERKAPLALWLQGWAMVQNGVKKDGEKRMELSHWIPLADEAARDGFATELAKRGHAEAAAREWDLLQKTSRPGSFHNGEAWRQLAVQAKEKRDFLKAADYEERSMLRIFQPTVSFLDNSAYIIARHVPHSLRARGLAAAGKFDLALKEVEVCQSLTPAHTDLLIHLLPEFEKHGRKKEADALYAKCRAIHEKNVLGHPESPWAHNGLAWLAAGCKRDLDDALKHALKAVELAPDTPGYLDTLAEAYFQHGDRARAIETMKKCVALEPGTAYFQKQLKRFEAGDRNAEIPLQGEDD